MRPRRWGNPINGARAVTVRLRRRGAITGAGSPGPGAESGAEPSAPSVVTCLVANGTQVGQVPVSLERAAALARRRRAFVWIPLEPDSTVITAAGAEFGLSAEAVEDAATTHERPKLEVHDDLVVVVLKPVHYVDADAGVRVGEVALVLGARFVITVERGGSEMVDKLRPAVEHGAQGPRFGPPDVLLQAVELVVADYLVSLERIGEDVENIEEKVFGVEADDHAEGIYKLKREVAEFRRMVTPLGRALDRVATGQVEVLDGASAEDFAAAHEDVLRVAEAIDGIDRLLSAVLDANVARVGVEQNRIALRQNEDMRKISAWAAIALVPAATAGVYGMNFEYMPELQWKYGYPTALAGIASICTLLYRAFRRNHWL